MSLSDKDIQAIRGAIKIEVRSSLKNLGKEVDQKFIHFRKVIRNDMVVVLGEFFENILAPYLDTHVEKQFDKLEERVGKIEKQQSLS